MARIGQVEPSKVRGFQATSVRPMTARAMTGIASGKRDLGRLTKCCSALPRITAYRLRATRPPANMSSRY